MGKWQEGVKARIEAIRWQASRVPGLVTVVLAFRNYIFHQSANNSGHVAFSAVLAMFPLILFLSAAASFIGEPGSAARLIDRLLEYAPPAVAEALLPVVDEVLGQRNRAMLTIGILTTLWAASSGAQATRMALNRAYGIERGLPFWAARLKVTVFTAVGTFLILLAFSTVVVVPYLNDLARSLTQGEIAFEWSWWLVRYAIGYGVLVLLYIVLYIWLPDLKQRMRTVLPGAFFGAALWLGAAAILSFTLRSSGNLSIVYGSFAGTVATLIFLYVSAATLILGAELNGVLHRQAEGEDNGKVPHPPRAPAS